VRLRNTIIIFSIDRDDRSNATTFRAEKGHL